MGKRFGVRGDGHTAGFHAELLDAETEVDDLSLAALRHDHAAQRVVVREVVPNHRLEKLFGRHVVGRLSACVGRMGMGWHGDGMAWDVMGTRGW